MGEGWRLSELDLGIDGLSDFKEIGSGGFATVYSALEVGLDRRVAVKLLAAIDDPGRRRFDRERQSMGRTADHPNIVTPLRSGYTSPGNRPYLVMEYLAGGSLQDRIDTEGPIPWYEAISLILPVAEALAFSHGSGIIHRDVKPANILISRTGVVKLTDFGIAAIRESTATSQVAFSMLYTAPETFDAHRDPSTGDLVDPRTERSDLYSLAATLYALGAGSPPFQSTSSAGLMGQILTQAAPSTGHLLLDQFLERAMAKHPADRHSTVAQFIEHLVAVQPSMADTHGSVLSPNSAADSQILDNAGAVSAPTMVAPENQRAHEHPTIGAQSLDNLSDSGTLHNAAQIGGPLGQPIALPNSEVASGRDRTAWPSPRWVALAVALTALALVLLYFLQTSRARLSFLPPGSDDTPNTTAPRELVRVESGTSDADDFIRYLVNSDGTVVELNHEITGRPGPGDVSVEYDCTAAAGCSTVRIQDSQVTYEPIEGGVWFRGCYRVVVDGNGYGAQALDLEMTYRGSTCP